MFFLLILFLFFYINRLDLLRRLSKSQNTVFCGKIQIFLSQLFPLDDKSSLNLMGHFNIMNITPFNEFSLERVATLKNTKYLYQQFWLLQDFFRNPVQCYEDGKFALYSSGVDDVLSFFLKSPDNSGNSYVDSLKSNESSFSNADITFTKYLTSEKLFDMQIMDSNIRRCFLVQLAVTSQYLLSTVRFKSDKDVLNDDQCKWIKASQIDLMKLLEGLSNDKERFKDIVCRILIRENMKSQWKNERCPSFVKKRKISNTGMELSEKSKARIIVDSNGQRVMVGLHHLLTKFSNNLTACKDSKRIVMPELSKYFAAVRTEIDSEENNVKECSVLNNERWCWASLRMLSRKSQYFYTNWKVAGQTIKEYLTAIIVELLPAGGEIDVETSDNDAVIILEPQLAELATMIGTRSTLVGEALGFKEHDLSLIEIVAGDINIRNQMMLNFWLDYKSTMKPTFANLLSALERVKLDDLVTKVKSWLH